MNNLTKRLLSLVIFVLAIAPLSFSQVKFGPRIGLNYAVVAGVNTNAHFKPGLHLGGYAQIGDGKVRFQPELLFSMKGYQYKNGSFKESQSLNYIDVPLMARFGNNFGFLLGVQPSLLLGAKYKSNITGPTESEDDKDLFNGFDLGFITGLEYELDNGLNFGTRFGIGTRPIFESSAFKKIINLNLQLTVGYTIGKE